jgi:hypothetical protein
MQIYPRKFFFPRISDQNRYFTACVFDYCQTGVTGTTYNYIESALNAFRDRCNNNSKINKSKSSIT